MESKVQEQTTTANLSAEVPGTLAKAPNSNMGEQPWQEWLEPVVDFLAKVPEYLSQIFSEYQKPLTTVGLLLLSFISIKIIFAVLGAVDDIPLLAPLMEMVGLGYSGWFVWRYLLKASSRKELLGEFDALKNQMFGDNA
ncbi:CAAD domain-containing protein [Crocosphaera sp.]|uniref:CAAD domain-containing protein n=1 Tax=Crocosphaera sp. TaxID=2729996 RepID=UPI002614B462|nr:CAAD domain-containing protein [Crocosphaera sp.]MDJ0582949.1 CAAD domain-containing protein [Crocosphaera sp.]